MPYFVLFLLLCLLASCRGDGTPAAGEGDFAVGEVALEVQDGAAAYVPDLEGPLRVLSATPGGTMPGMAPGQSVAVTFSRPMVVLGKAPEVPPGTLTLTPAVPGALRWEGTQTLVFQPDEPLPPATAFRATLAAGLTALSGDVLRAPFVWTFETPRPMLVSSTPADGAVHVALQPTLYLRFNQALAASAPSYLVLRPQKAPAGPVPVSIHRAEGDSVLVLRPDGPLQRGTIYELVLRPGLPAARGALGLQDETVVRFTTYDQLRLQAVTQPRGYGEEEEDLRSLDPERGLTLVFSTPVRFADLRRALSFSPPVDLPPGIEARDAVVSTEHTLPLPWQPETSYTLTLRDLADTFGQRLEQDSRTFRTRPYRPSARMHGGLLVIEAEEQAAVPVRATNVEAVQLGARRLRADEVVPALRTYDQHRYYGSGTLQAPEPVPAQRTWTLDLPRNTPGTVPLRLDSLLTGGTGIVGLRMVVPKQPGEQDAQEYRALAQVTRLGLTAKFSPHQNLILVTDLKTAQPVPDAAVTIRDADNRVRWQGRTDAQGRAAAPGWAALGIPQQSRWDRPVQFAFAERDGDLIFTSSLYDDGLEPYRFDVWYDWAPTARTEAGSIFSDRGLYRTGETVYLKGILRHRTDGDWQAVQDSLRILIRSPRDEIVFDGGLSSSALGTFDLSWTVPPQSDQGIFTVRVVHAYDTTAATRAPYEEGDIAQGFFRVDAFRTATFAVTARTAAPAYVAGDFFEGTLEGRYLFGAAMAGQPARYSLVRRPGWYHPPGFEAYRFGGFSYEDEGGLYQTLARADTVLDGNGAVQVRLPLPGNEQGVPTTLAWSGSVEDPARQEGADLTDVTLHPGLFYIGLKPGTTFLDLGRSREMTVDVITVDPAGRPVDGQDVTVALVREQWNSVREVGTDGRLRWRSERTEEPVGAQQVRTAPGKAVRLRMPVTAGGRYRIRAEGRDTRGNRVRTETYFYAAGPGYVAWQRTDDDRIELVPEKTRYRPGETARLMVQSPYERATALVTVEREGILSSEVVTLEGSAPQVAIPLGEEHLPNVFVSVILLSGRAAAPGPGHDTGAPGFKIGYAQLQVDPGVRRLQVEVTPDRPQYRPGDEVTVRLQLRDASGRGVPGEVAFSAADAGVLNLIDYALPDPFDAFYGSRPLGVATSEVRAHLIEQRSFGQKEEDLIGGGGDAGFLLRKDFRPLAHWAPAVQTDGRGRATVTFRLPESLTTFRLMAAALSEGNLFGAGRTDVVVTQPLVLQPALPRFVRLGDRFEAGVLITNASEAAGEATVTARAEGLDLAGPDRQTLYLQAGETKEVRFRWTAARMGDTRLTFEAQLGRERDAFVLSVPITLPATKQTWATFAATDAAAQEALRLPEAWVRGIGRFEARLSSTALVGLDGAAQYLFTYPYGCLEQRTSAVRPLLAADDLLDAFDLDVLQGGRKAEIDRWLQDLRDFWIGDGFSLWAGERYRHPYVSAYVVLALAEARDAGFSIPQELTRQAADGLEASVRNRSERPDSYGQAAWADTRALMLYALARHGRVLESEIHQLAQAALDDPDALSIDGQSHLLRTLVLALRPTLDRFRQPLLERIERRTVVEATTAYLAAPAGADFGWIFASDVRTTAFGLTALIEADPSADRQQLAQRMVRYLMQARQGGHWASTQDNAAVIEAFQAFYEAYEQAVPDFVAEVKVAGQSILQESFRGRSLAVADVSRPLETLPGGADVPVVVAKQGEGPVYYSLRLEAYSSTPQPAARNGISVERRLQRLDGRGQPVGEALLTGDAALTLQAGELVRVVLRIASPTERHYVVVDDALPAGLEALNAAFGTTSQEVLQNADAGQERWWGSFNHTEIRDDRVLLFADYLERGEHTYTYVARATTPGTFVHPPAAAEMMYQPETNGRTATGTLVVQAPGSGTAAR